MSHFTQAILRGEGDPVRALCLHLGERVEHGQAPLRHGPQREATEGQDRMNTMSSKRGTTVLHWISDIVTTIGQGQNSHNIQYVTIFINNSKTIRRLT